MKSWINELFGVEKPVIGMCHMQAMPGDPKFDATKGLDWVLEQARADMLALQEGGIDAIMFSNEFSLPYLTKVESVTVACMAALIGELKREINVPYGVNVLWDPQASIDVAMATGAQFVREIFTGVYASDFGLWNTNVGEVIRHQHAPPDGGLDIAKSEFDLEDFGRSGGGHGRPRDGRGGVRREPAYHAPNRLFQHLRRGGRPSFNNRFCAFHQGLASFRPLL